MPTAAGTPCRSLPEEGHVAVGQRRLRPAADGAAHLGRGQRRGVVDPVPDHQHPVSGVAAWPARAATLSSRAECAAGIGDAEGGGDGIDGRCAVTAQDGGRQAERAQVVDGGYRLGPQGSRHRQDAEHPVVRPDHDDGLPSGVPLVDRSGQGRRRDAPEGPVPPRSGGRPPSPTRRYRRRPGRRWPSGRQRPHQPGPPPRCMAVAIGWSLADSTAAARATTVPASSPATTATPVTSACRSVRVPVLSNATRSTRARRSSASPLRTKMPIAAARPHPTIIATGAARPMAHGQATRRTARADSTARPKLPTTIHQTRNVHGRADEDGGHEHGADPVGDPLQGRLVPLGLLDQALQPGQHRFGGDRGHLDDEDPTAVAGPAGDLVARTPVDRAGARRSASTRRRPTGRW